LTDTYCLDTSRFFASGKSQGGGLIGNILACDETMSTTFAAFAPVSGAFYTDADPCGPPYTFEIPCQPGRNDVPMLEFHGGRDDVVNYTGANQRGSCLPDIPWWVESWAINDGLSTNGKTEPLADDTPNTNITRYGTGSKRGLVSHIFDAIIGHHWPSTSFNSDNNGAVAEFNATPIIIDFFDSHPL
jgi:poly(3-hydroxybutyrate) depolymerase